MPFKHITPVGTAACRIVYHVIFYSFFKRSGYGTEWLLSGFEIRPIRLSDTCQHISGQVKCSYMVIRRTSPHFFCNLKLGLLKLQEETVGSSHADLDQDDVFLAGSGVLQGSVGRAVCYCFTPVFARRCWAIIHGFPIRQRPGEAVVYSKQPILARAISNRLLGST